MFFVIPEMPSKTFFMLYKKLPDHFKYFKATSLWLLMRLFGVPYTFMDVVVGVPGGAGRAGQGQVYGCFQVQTKTIQLWQN